MKQEAKYTITHFADAADKAINGATIHPELIVFTQGTIIAQELAAMLAARDAYENEKSAWGKSRAAARLVTKTAREALAVGRDLLKRHFGTRYNQGWDVTGLVGSTEIPRSFEQVKWVLRSFAAHFSAHPERENAALDITAAHFSALHEAMVLAQNNETSHLTAAKTLLSERNLAIRAMEKRLRVLFGELKLRLDPMDPRWLAFGFKLPGLKERPATPEPPTPVLVTEESASLKWKPAARAKHYRVWMKEGKGEPKLAGTSRDKAFVIEDLATPKEKVAVSISAVNPGGESERSEWVTIKEATSADAADAPEKPTEPSVIEPKPTDTGGTEENPAGAEPLQI